VLALVSVPSSARAQAGVSQRALPNVLLLVDTSGSMERMIDNTLPKDNVNPQSGLQNTCVPGTASNPNRWARWTTRDQRLKRRRCLRRLGPVVTSRSVAP